MIIDLVAMPWGDFGTPSAALGALSAYVRNKCPDFKVACHSEYVEVAERIGIDRYRLISRHQLLAEQLYLSLLFPERCPATRSSFANSATASFGKTPHDAGINTDTWDQLFDALRHQLDEHARTKALELARRAGVVGLTTSLFQTFSSLALAQQIKSLNRNTVIVLGGASVVGMSGLSILHSFPFVDYIVQGEGEKPFSALLKSLAKKHNISPDTPGIITRESIPHTDQLRNLWAAPGLDDLPMPDYDEYAEKADRYSIIWNIPAASSRGCWWDRTEQTGNPRNRCYFCNYSTGRYREKSAARVACEVDFLARRYQNVRFMFTDNAIRPHGIQELTHALKKRRPQLSFFTSFRANMLPIDILRLNESGMTRCECGIEGLSNSYLKRINKGTSVMQNLQVLKTCHELGIWNNTNLITGFPGATEAEVNETVETIYWYAAAYYPSGRTIPFHLCIGSTVDRFREAYGIHSVRNSDAYRTCMPVRIWKKLELLDRSWDGPAEADWSPVLAACDKWRELHDQVRADERFPYPHPLYYHDGGDFLEIVDRRGGACRTLTFPSSWRLIYLFCMSIRADSAIHDRFGALLPRKEIETILDRFVAEKVMFQEGRSYLSLAVATTPAVAARRIRAQVRWHRKERGNQVL